MVIEFLAVTFLAVLLIDLLLLLHHHVLLYLFEWNLVTILVDKLLRLSILIVEAILSLHLVAHHLPWWWDVLALSRVVELVDGTLCNA